MLIMLNHSLLAYQDTNLNFINDADVPWLWSWMDSNRPDTFGGWCNLELEKFSLPYHESILFQGQE